MKVIRTKDPVRKTNLENEYRLYKTQLDETLQARKSLHYQNLFEINKLNLQKMWRELEKL